MKKITIFLLAALLATAGAAAQNPSAYFMEGTTFRSQFNPAFAPLRGYFNIPFLGGIQLNVGGGLSVDKLFFPRDGRLVSFLDPSVTVAESLSGLKKNNLLGLDTRINMLGFGAFTRNHKSFWSVDVNLRVNAEFNLPRSLFEFSRLGKEGSIANLGMLADSYAEIAGAYSFPLLDDKLYVGARVKFLAGLARAHVTFDRFDISLQDERWAIDATGAIDVSLSGLEMAYTEKDGRETFMMDDIEFSTPKGPTGYGFAVDLGATYDILPGLQASLAVTDLGFINWGKGNTVSGSLSKNVEYTGVEIVGGEVQELDAPEFDTELEFERSTAGTTKMLRATINAGIEYEVWRHKVGVGLLYSARVWNYKSIHDLVASVNFHPVRWFTLTGSYSLIVNRGSALGLALNLCPGGINFFVGTDVLVAKHTKQWVPVKQSSMNVTFGLGVPMGKRSHRIAEYIREKDKR